MKPRQDTWKLVAPWYRWPRQIHEDAMALDPRRTRPVIQKFDEPGFVKSFLKDPQRSLVFGVNDRVQAIREEATTPGPSCRRTTVYAPNGAPPQNVWLCPTDIRKIYLDVHRRYYLVVCQLHCDRPGFPRVPFDRVCRAGFVVRRRWTMIPRVAEPEAKRRLERILDIEQTIADLDELRPMRPAKARRRKITNDALRAEGRFDITRRAAFEALLEERRELERWRDEAGVARFHEGWRSAGGEGLGRWSPVAEEPQTIDEVTFPLYPLRPDPDDRDHDGAKQSLYFGVLPTSSLDTERNGTPRFDSKATYEIRCFVQRFVPNCPPPARPEDCHGEVVWSLPTEPYQLAKAADPIGAANRAVTIELPDFREMVAHAAVMPRGRLATTRVDQPQGLMPTIDGDGALSGGGFELGQICFFAIPLITIVAMFVLKLFIPIIVFMFGLWFLLAFKFCIPPSIGLSAGLQLELQAMGELGLDFEVEVSAELQAMGILTPAQLATTLQTSLEGYFAASEGIPIAEIDLSTNTNNRLLATMYVHNPTGEPDPPGTNAPPFGPDIAADRHFEPRVEAHWEFV